MIRRGKEAGGPPPRPEVPWFAAAMLGLTISTLAGSAAALGAGAAVAETLLRSK